MIKLRGIIDNKVKEWDEVIAGASTEKVGLALVREKRRWLCRNDLFYLCGMAGQEKITQYPDYYKPFCDEVSLINWQVTRLKIHKTNEDLISWERVADETDFEYIQRMYLCHRVFYKTTIITKVSDLQLLLNFVNIHIILCHNKQNNASANLVAIKNMFLTTEIGRIFPECIPRGKEWGSMSAFSLANRTDKSRDEDNIMAAGVDTNITGGHWQIARKNDLVTESSVTTKEQLEKTKAWDDLFNQGNFDDPQTPLQDYEGTRYHFSDLYSSKLGDPHIKKIYYPILKDGNPDNITKKNISNPDRFTEEGIAQLKSKNIWVFMCQMILKPEDPARMQFKKEMIAYFSSMPKGLIFYLFVDPASARKKKSDYTVMKVVGYGWHKFPYESEYKLRKLIVDGLRDKLDPKQRVDKAIEFAEKWQIKGCGWEAIAFQETDSFYVEERRRVRGLHFTITEIKSHKAAKEDRIRSLVPEYAQHQWLWPEKGKLVKHSIFDGHNYDLTEEMEYELLQFPLCEHDDLLDTDTFFNKISTIKPEQVKQDNEPQGMTFGQYAALKDDRLSEEAKDVFGKFKLASRV